MSESPRLLVFAPNWLGDAVMALPAIDDLRRHLEARVIVAARRSVARLFSLVPWVDEIVELEWRSSITNLATMRRDIQRLRAAQAQVALLLPNSFASAWLALTARVSERWGYATDGRSRLLTRAIERPIRPATSLKAPRAAAEGSFPSPVQSSTGLHQGAYYQYLVHAVGALKGPLEPRIVVPSPVSADAQALLTSRGWDGARPIVVCAPGAAYGTAKQWWPTHYAQLAADLVALHGVQVVLVGSAADAETTGEIRGLLPAAAHDAVIDLAGQTTLEVLAGVLSAARVCVSNDSGAMHLAAAVGTPLTALFGPTDEHETSPLVHAPVALLIHPVPCRPCMLRECPIDHPCMRDLTPARVLSSVIQLLGPPEGGPHRTAPQVVR
jgi:heptosyltransferase-2